MVRKRNFHGLKKLRVRQSWNKYNLYNLSRLEQPFTTSRTFFQQKWTAKAQARAYHGEQIRERQWTRMFSRYLPAVVPMDVKELAKDDGSEQGAGRGSGRDVAAGGDFKMKKSQTTPYMSMTFYPAERRLDTAVFRALFASSARQARQFCVHGFVKVNGKKMKYPGYLLNPGDMFSVDPDMVMFSTGAKKGNKSTHGSDENRQAQSKLNEQRPDAETEEDTVFDEAWEDEAEEDIETATGTATSANANEDSSPEAIKSRSKELKLLRDQIKEAATTTKGIRAKRKQELRALYTTIRKTNFNKVAKQDLEEWKAQFERLQKLLLTANSWKQRLKTEDEADQNPLSVGLPVRTRTSEPRPKRNTTTQTDDEDPLVQEQLRKMRKNPHLAALLTWPNKSDKSKPYQTPWQPRDYMSAFTFIPRYLEVNQNVCSAVYLRDPVARPGLAEVPSPFHPETSQLAFQWYLRRR